jgi:hypothetical protein
MRTTLTLDDDLAHQLRELVRRTGSSFKEVVNSAIRSGLSGGKRPVSALPKFRVRPKPLGFRAGVDLLKLNQLSDQLEVEDFERELVRDLGRR